MVSKVTHLIANACGGDKYQYAVTFRVPVMGEKWVHAMWEKRNEKALSAASEEMVCITEWELSNTTSYTWSVQRVCDYFFPR
jgi:hypothetical protein